MDRTGDERFEGGFHRTERGVFSILAHDPQRPLVNTAEREDRPAGNFPGPGTPMTMAEMEDSIERVLGVRVPLEEPPEGAPRLLRRLCHRNSRLAERYRDGRVFLAGDAEPWNDRVRRVTATADNAPASALLIRPDGYVAWAGTDPDGLKAALTRWFSSDQADMGSP